MVNKFSIELLSLLVSLLVASMIMLPIYLHFGLDYPFYISNIAFILIFLNFVRYIFLLKYTPFSHSKMVKLILLFICIPILLFAVESFYIFRQFVDETGFYEISPKISASKSQMMAKFTKYQYLIFASGTFITLILIPIRMIRSIWRVTNNKGV